MSMLLRVRRAARAWLQIRIPARLVSPEHVRTITRDEKEKWVI